MILDRIKVWDRLRQVWLPRLFFMKNRQRQFGTSTQLSVSSIELWTAIWSEKTELYTKHLLRHTMPQANFLFRYSFSLYVCWNPRFNFKFPTLRTSKYFWIISTRMRQGNTWKFFNLILIFYSKRYTNYFVWIEKAENIWYKCYTFFEIKDIPQHSHFTYSVKHKPILDLFKFIQTVRLMIVP